MTIPERVLFQLYSAGAPDRAIARILGISSLRVFQWRSIEHRLPAVVTVADAFKNRLRWEVTNKIIVDTILTEAGLSESDLHDPRQFKEIG